MEPTPIDAPKEKYTRVGWWLKNKDDPRIVELMRAARRKYYYKNQEKEKKRAREYYHIKKAVDGNIPAESEPSVEN